MSGLRLSNRYVLRFVLSRRRGWRWLAVLLRFFRFRGRGRRSVVRRYFGFFFERARGIR